MLCSLCLFVVRCCVLLFDVVDCLLFVCCLECWWSLLFVVRMLFVAGVCGVLFNGVLMRVVRWLLCVGMLFVVCCRVLPCGVCCCVLIVVSVLFLLIVVSCWFVSVGCLRLCVVLVWFVVVAV